MRNTSIVDDVVDVDGVTLHYRDLGPRGGTPIVLIHGVMGHAREWDVVTGRLGGRRRVVAIELRGHGGSDWSPPYTVDRMAEDVATAVEALGLGRVVLVGHSLGGLVSMVLAARRSELVAGVVILDAVPGILGSGFALQAPVWLAEMADARFSSVDEALVEWSQNPFARPELLRHYLEHVLIPDGDGGLRYGFDAAGLASWFPRLATERSLWEAVERIVAPTVLVRGEHSPFVSATDADDVVRRLESGTAAVVAGAAHDLGVEAPEAVVGVLEPILDDILGAAVVG